MMGKAVGDIGLTVVALLIGALGIVVFIGVGEALNNAIAAFAAVSVFLALVAGFLAWLSPRAQWSVAVVISAPVALLCVVGVPMGAIYLPGGMWTVLCAVGGSLCGRAMESVPRAEIRCAAAIVSTGGVDERWECGGCRTSGVRWG